MTSTTAPPGFALTNYLFAICYGLGITTAVVAVTVSPLAALALSDNINFSSLPAGLQFFTVVAFSYLLSRLSAQLGRKIVFRAAAIIGVISGCVAAYATHSGSFYWYLFSHVLLGIFLTSVNLYRYAIMDACAPILKSRALNLLLFGGVIAALLGPFIARNVNFSEYLNQFTSIFLAVAVLCAIVFVILLFCQSAAAVVQHKPMTVPLTSLLRNPTLLLAICSGAITYSVMNILMLSTSVFMREQGYSFNNITWYIQIHVLFMFAPSLITGKVIAWMQIKKFMFTGLIVQFATSIVAILFVNANGLLVTMILLGLAWNILYSGSSYLIGNIFKDNRSFAAQGLGDTTISFFSAIGALLAGLALATFGWVNLNLLVLGLIALLTIAVIIWQHELNADRLVSYQEA